MMDCVLRGLQWLKCLVYIDDVIAWSSTIEEHQNRLQEIFERLQDAGLKLNIKKCKFGYFKVPYLGHLVSHNGIEPDPGNVQIVKKIPTPTTPKQCLRFAGLANYYRDFLPNFADKVAELYRLGNLDKKNFEWPKTATKNFEILKKDLCTYPSYSCLSQTEVNHSYWM